MQRLNISRAHAFILVYSVTSRQSLTELGPILQNILEVRNGSTEGIPIMLAGNKCDETENREVNRSEGEEQARKWRCNFTETSAKTNYNVKELFQELLAMEKNRNITLSLDGKDKSQKGPVRLKEKCVVI
jgi:GTPase SAR1 family protein